MRIIRHENPEQMRDLAQSWNTLLEQSSSDTIFLTWEWCEAWWNAYGGNRQLFVLSAWDEDELVGIAPFYRDEVSRWGQLWKCLRIIGDGSGDSDYLDCFIQRGREERVLSYFLEFLDRECDQWDWLQIGSSPENSTCLPALIAAAKEKGWKSDCSVIPCASLLLPKTWDDYLRMLHPRIRTKVRSSLAVLEQQLRLVPTQCLHPEQVDPWLAQLFEVHTRRWEQAHGHGVFLPAARRRFYGDVSRSTLQKGWLAFHRLAWGERSLALQYGFRYRDRFYLLQEAYDPLLATLRPGISLRGWLMRYWIDQGLKEYDFLEGTATHKFDWGARQKFSCRLLLAKKRAATWVSISAPALSGSLRTSIRGVVPQSVLTIRKSLLRRPTPQPDRPPSPDISLAKRIVHRSASHLYSHTPLGTVGRSLANRYTWSGSGHSSARLRLRSVPACSILLYHRVNDNRDPLFNSLPVANFREQMSYLARNFRLVSLDQVASPSLPSNGNKYSVAVSFDDGYRDNYLYAFPILKAMGIPATIFLTTGYIDSGELPWYDQVRLAFKLTVEPRISLDEYDNRVFLLGSMQQRLNALVDTLVWLRGIDEVSRPSVVQRLFRKLRVPNELNLPNTMLGWDEIRRMNKEGISFGAHSVTHPVLANLPVGRLHEEIGGSKTTVEERLQVSVRHFSYPFGKQADFSATVKKAVRAAGFQTAVTTIAGVNSPEQDLLELRRFTLHEPNLGMFGLKLDWARMSARQAV